MASLHADENSSAAGDESITHKCRVLNEKLDQLLGTLHEEASPVHSAGTPRVSIDEEDLPDEQPEHPEMMKSSKEAKECRNEGRAARQKGARKVVSSLSVFPRFVRLIKRNYLFFCLAILSEDEIQPERGADVEGQQLEKSRPADHRARGTGVGRAERDSGVAFDAFGQRQSEFRLRCERK